MPPYEYIKDLNDNNVIGNVYTRWQWSGIITFMSNKKLQVFVDTRIEPFNEDDINIAKYGWQKPEELVKILKTKNTNYILLPLDEYFEKWEYLDKNNAIDIKYKNNYYFFAVLLNKKD